MLGKRQTEASRVPRGSTRRLLAMLLGASWLAVGAAVGEEGSSGRAAKGSQVASVGKVGTRDVGADLDLAAVLRSVKPKVSGYAAAPLWSKLNFAYRGARERIRTMPGCSTLFTSRGVDGLELLANVSFGPATPGRDRGACARSAALTEVGGRQIRLCPRFEALSPSTAALVLIHEALHNAGMSEKPPDPSAPTSAEISRLVKVNCGN